MRVIDGECFSRFRAVHRDWTGHILLSQVTRLAFHEETGARGTYELGQNLVTVIWNCFPADLFVRCQKTLIERSLHIPSFESLYAGRIGSSNFEIESVSVILPRFEHPVKIRMGTADTKVFEHIFVNREYDIPHLPNSMKKIIDLGANIGLSALFFAFKYPDAEILCVEADRLNYRSLLANTDALGNRVKAIHGAVWDRDGQINIRHEDESGRSLESWGVQTVDSHDSRLAPICCHTLDTIVKMTGPGKVDLLKVDIEGAELEVFTCEKREWLLSIDFIVIETHDRFRPGTEDAVRKTLLPLFRELPPKGENLIFARC